MKDESAKKNKAIIGYIIYILVTAFAMYLVYVRNKQSGTREIIAGIISALCCTPCYIGFAFANPVKFKN